jgi:hypothetical protein
MERVMAVKEPAKESAPSQPTVQVRQPGSPDTKTIRSNDPVTNRAEQSLAEEAARDEAAIGEEQARAAAEEAKRLEEEHQMKMELLLAIVQSPEGFVVRDEDNDDAFGLASVDGLVYHNNVQSGKGMLDVEERVYLSSKGMDSLTTALGPSMGRKGK